MNVIVSIPSPFRRHTEGLDRVDCTVGNLNELFDVLETRFPELKPHLRDQEGKVRRFLNVYVNDEDIRFLGANYSFQEGDEVTLVPSIAGGSMSPFTMEARDNEKPLPLMTLIRPDFH